jgi:hypothetical protein
MAKHDGDTGSGPWHIGLSVIIPLVIGLALNNSEGFFIPSIF